MRNNEQNKHLNFIFKEAAKGLVKLGYSHETAVEMIKQSKIMENASTCPWIWVRENDSDDFAQMVIKNTPPMRRNAG